jgi:eukaryotic-like serine/threonine-protein kinase
MPDPSLVRRYRAEDPGTSTPPGRQPASPPTTAPRNVDAIPDVCSSTRPDPVTDTLAQRLREALGPDYTLERELGGAGMSRVFVATERALGRRVVVKVLPPDLAAGVNIERFRREIQLAAQLQHPHVVPLLTAGERDELLWFTMPFIEGESLRTTLERRTRLPAPEVMRILHDVVDALAYAHSRGVVHRDIKPGNILMSGSHAVVTDFGVAKALSAAIPLAGHTTSGMAIGTPAYMAPEQLAADPAADHRVDLYAVGLLAYELLTGASPFSGSSPQATLAAQLTERPKAPHLAHADVPASLSRIIMQCLEKDANKRPPTATALLDLLTAAQSELSGEMAAASLARTRRGLFAASALFVAATAVFLVSRRGGDAASAVPRDSVPVAAETVVVYRPIPMSGDAQASVSMPLVLSAAESTAIVQAYRDRAGVGGAPQTDDIDRDSLLAEVSRLFADSISRAMTRMETALAGSPRQLELQALVRQMQGIVLTDSASRTAAAIVARPLGDTLRRPPRAPGDPAFVAPLIPPPTPGTRRLAILPYTDRTNAPEFAALGTTLLDSISVMLRGMRGGRLEIVTAEDSKRLLGDTPMRSTSAGFALRANYVLSGGYFVRNDSLMVITVLTDVQGGTETRSHLESVPRSGQSGALVPSTTSWVRARLDSMRRTMGTRTPPPGMERRERQR